MVERQAILERSHEEAAFIRTGDLLHLCVRNRHTHFLNGKSPISTTHFPVPYNYRSDLCHHREGKGTTSSNGRQLTRSRTSGPSPCLHHLHRNKWVFPLLTRVKYRSRAAPGVNRWPFRGNPPRRRAACQGMVATRWATNSKMVLMASQDESSFPLG